MDGFPDFGTNGKTQPWPEPLDFLADADLTGAPELRQEHLPEPIAPFVFDTAARLGVDPAAVALASLVALASVMDDTWALQPKQNDSTWTENPRIWGGIVGDPSMLKSPIVKVATTPIDRMEIEARERHKAAMLQHKVALKKWKEDGCDPTTEPRLPRLDRYMVEGTTTEALSEVLRDDDKATQYAPAHKVLIRQDELSEWLASFDRYRAGGNGGTDRGSYLRLFNGGRHTLDRVVRGHIAIQNWSACILGGIQPAVIRRIAKEAAEDGLLQRFSFCVPAHQSRGEDRKPDNEAAARYDNLFPALAALRPARDSYNHPQHVVLHADAHKHRIEILDLTEALAATPDTSNRMKAALGKWPGLWARMTLVFHLIEVADVRARGMIGPMTYVANDAAARATAYLRQILLPHLIRADAVMFDTEQTGHARWIAGHMLSKGAERISARDIMKAYGALRAPEHRRELLTVMDSLEIMGWVQAVIQDDGRAPTNWEVNPRIHTGFAKRAKQERERRESAKQRMREAIARTKGNAANAEAPP